jgi:hypothetical protein
MRSATYRPAAAPINVAPISDIEFAVKYAHCVRHGKTRRDRANGHHSTSMGHKQKPIRQTSSHRIGGQDNRGREFWQG